MSKKARLVKAGRITYIRPASMSYDRIKRIEKVKNQNKKNGGKKAC